MRRQLAELQIANESLSNRVAQALTNNVSGETLDVQKTALLDYTALKSAAVTKSPSDGGLHIDIEFSDLGKELSGRHLIRSRSGIFKPVELIPGG